MSTAELLWDNGGRISPASNIGTLFSSAAQDANIAVLKEFIRFGVDVNVVNNEGQTALHVAVAQNSVTMATFLLSEGADARRPDTRGVTPLELARQEDMAKMESLLESNNINVMDDENSTRNIVGSSKKRSDSSIKDAILPALKPILKPAVRRDRTSGQNTLLQMLSDPHSLISNLDQGLLAKGMPRTQGTFHKRVVIHRHLPRSRGQNPPAKLFVLPNSLRDLLDLAGELRTTTFLRQMRP